MKRWRKILGGVIAVLVVAILGFGAYVGHDAPCGTARAAATGGATMRAAVYRCYGGPEVVRIETIPRPIPAEHEVLVKVYAASVNPLDWHYLRGIPYLLRLSSGIGAPADFTLGADFSGTVEAVGNAVTRFKPGDAVFGDRSGAFGEYLSVIDNHAIATKPANVSFEAAAALPIAAITALQALRDNGKLRRGQTILINGAAGGVGTYAVQIAKSFGADVTVVASNRSLDLLRSLGADHLIDYAREDFTRGGQKYDVLLDTVGNHTLGELRRVLAPAATVILIGGGGSGEGKWIGPLIGPLKAVLYSWFVSQRFTFMLADANAPDLAALAKLAGSGELTSVIDRRWPLAETAAAIDYVEAGHTHGKVVIDVVSPELADGSLR